MSGSVLDCEVGDLLVFTDNLFNQKYPIDRSVRVVLYVNQIVLVINRPTIIVHEDTILVGNPLTLALIGQYSIDRFERYLS